MVAGFSLMALVLLPDVFAAETDAFTLRHVPITDAMPVINQEFNRRVLTALQSLNEAKVMCSPSALDAALAREIRRPFRGLLEDFIDTSELVPRQRVPLKDSVYRETTLLLDLALTVGNWIGIGLTSHIQHEGLLIGADKFGHFLDEGYYYYYLVYRKGFTLEQTFRLGELIESTFEGSGSSGVYSYADLTANYTGFQFWRDMLGTDANLLESRYVSCESKSAENNWRLKSEVDLLTYLSAAWDEGMNCSQFRNEEITQGVERSILALEASSYRRYRCPVYPERVFEMISRVSEVKEHVIHPSLLKDYSK